ncbi:HAD-like protein [Dothidotthia symphoricarpi CBS 119687]|uniref:HAD-like protein n=1 Tax=Dothidotthia symphoricarpi CBS 119687 TaxID=1392245 RepID=A0A6A6A9Y3_9PLEO|nr:HAD-like protein [Dothidotthia symphoricarpi CBS 119687]KAF2127491.1 HAD-like protein [Dothidotthia symphoricarpi CBS 119687]
MTKSASFDVIGTCFDFTHPIETIHSRLGDKLSTAAVDPKTLFFSWFYAAQRDFTYVSLAGSYKPIAEILKLTFRRACRVVDLPADVVTDEDLAELMKAFKAMIPRTGLKDCFDGLREAGWDVYGVTNGGVETSLGYYHNANIDLDREHLLSCDDLKIAKPDVRVYENANSHLTSRGVGKKGDDERWFVAAHAWDLIAAKKAGFKTAYLDFEEHDPVTEVFGEFDLYAKDMTELLAKLKEVA